jgi:hypothetical protein
MPTQAEIDALRYKEPDWLAKALYKGPEKKAEAPKEKGWRKKKKKPAEKPQGVNQGALNVHEKANAMAAARKE